MTQLPAPKSMSTVRKLAITSSVLLFLLLILLILPFLIDFSNFKPQIQSVVSQVVNAKVDFESARLQILPSVGIKVKGVVIENNDDVFKGTKLFAVDSLIIEAKLLPLFSGKVLGNVRILAPEFTMVKKGIKNNITSLIKLPVANGTPEPAKQPETKDDTAKMAETMKKVQANLLIEGIYIDGANITIRDVDQKESKEPVRVQDMNVAITNIGLDRDILIRANTNVDINEAGAKVKGLIIVDKTIHVNMGGSGLEQVTFKGKLSYDDLNINYRNAFVKNAGIPMNLTFNGSFRPGDLKLDDLAFNLHNLKLEAKAHIVNFADPNLKATIKVENENLASLGDLLPKHKDMLLNGQMHLNAIANGRMSDLGTLQAHIDFDTKLAGTDVDLKLETTGILPFKGRLDVNSQRIDLDSLLGPFLKKSTDAPTTNEGTQDVAKDTQKQAPEAPLKDFTLTDDQKKIILGTDAEIHFGLKEIIYSTLKLTNFKVALDQKNFIGTLKQFNIDGFGGKIAASGRVDLEPNPIPFEGTFKLTEIHPEQVMLVLKPEHKDLLVGRMNVDLSARGKGTTIPTLNKTLNGQGTFRFLDGELHTKSIAATMGDELDKFMTSLSISGAGQSIFDAAEKLLNSPIAKMAGKNPPDLSTLKKQYQNFGKVKFTDKTTASRSLKDVGGHIEIRDGKIYILSAISDNLGLMEFKSYIDLEMKLGGTSVFTASETTKTKLLSQSQYAGLIFDDKNNLIVPMTLGGTVTDPKVTLGSEEMKATFSKKAQALVEKEVKKAAEEYIKRLLGENGKNSSPNKKLEDAKAKAKEAVNNSENQKKAKEALKGLFGK